MGNLFDLDNELLKENNETADALRKAYSLCMREMYREALVIYNKIIEKDYDNEEAYIGILRAHSENFTKTTGEEVEKDIRVIKRFFPNTKNEDYLVFVKKIENPEFDQNQFKLFVDKCLALKKMDYEQRNRYQSQEDIKTCISYFKSVYENETVQAKYKVQACYYLGLAYYFNDENGASKRCFEYVVDHYKAFPNYQGEAHYELAMYYCSNGYDEKTMLKYLWAGANEFHNENCIDLLRTCGLL